MSREFGVMPIYFDSKSELFEGIESPTDVLMSHGDSVLSIPEGFKPIATTKKPLKNVIKIEVAKDISAEQKQMLKIMYPEIDPEVIYDLPEGFMVQKDYILTINQ
jgi:hypothetical protein